MDLDQDHTGRCSSSRTRARGRSKDDGIVRMVLMTRHPPRSPRFCGVDVVVLFPFQR